MARCLVVDDSEAMREIASDHLTALGHDVSEAADAESALARLDDEATRDDVVFLDWDLPALGALDVLRGAARLSVRPAIIICATEHDTRQLSLAAAAGAPHHLLKPFGRADIARVLDQVEVPVGP